MPEATQNYDNHTRWHFSYHFILFPLNLFHVGSMTVQLYQAPSFPGFEALLVAGGFLMLQVVGRRSAVKAQDRIIRLEEQLRYEKVLPAALVEQACALPERLIIALRFAPDEELPDLAQQVVDGKFTTPKEIKLAVKNWRADHFRV